MAWTAPKLWVVGGMVTAADLNLHVRDNFTAGDKHTHSGAAGDGSAFVGPITFFQWADFLQQPGTVGTLVRNDGGGGDPDGLLQLRDGSGIINIHTTQSDAAAATPSLRSLGNTGTQATAGNHTH